MGTTPLTNTHAHSRTLGDNSLISRDSDLHLITNIEEKGHMTIMWFLNSRTCHFLQLWIKVVRKMKKIENVFSIYFAQEQWKSSTTSTRQKNKFSQPGRKPSFQETIFSLRETKFRRIILKFGTLVDIGPRNSAVKLFSENMHYFSSYYACCLFASFSVQAGGRDDSLGDAEPSSALSSLLLHLSLSLSLFTDLTNINVCVLFSGTCSLEWGQVKIKKDIRLVFMMNYLNQTLRK